MTGYREEQGVPSGSRTETYVAIQLFVDNWRWGGVPFYIRTGKRLPTRVTEIVIHFKASPHSLFCEGESLTGNQLVIRIQPDEGIHMNIVNKFPGVKLVFNTKKLDLSYSSAYEKTIIPEAYESLILDIVRGEKALFIRYDELQAAWDIFTPVLHWLEDNKVEPEPYPFGTNGPRKD